MEMLGSSTEKTVALFLGCASTPMLAQKRRFEGIVTIQKQSQATISKFKTHDFCKCFQQWHKS
jgi:hypothetical protein